MENLNLRKKSIKIIGKSRIRMTVDFNPFGEIITLYGRYLLKNGVWTVFNQIDIPTDNLTEKTIIEIIPEFYSALKIKIEKYENAIKVFSNINEIEIVGEPKDNEEFESIEDDIH